MTQEKAPTGHRMTRRSKENDYSQPGMYHITVRVADGAGHPFGRVAGDASLPDGCAGAPHVELSAVGRMVEHELLTSIPTYYPMVEVQDYVVMPEHIHFIIEVHETIISRQGRKAHLGQVIAGFKKGCNRRYWEMTGQGTPAPTGGGSWPAVSPQMAAQPGSYKVPSRASTGRPVLFAEGYVDVMPLRSGQLRQQREYIRNNPRSRLLRSTHRDLLQPQRGGIDTALSVKALMGYPRRECTPWQLTDETIALIKNRLLMIKAPGGENPPTRTEQTGAVAPPPTRTEQVACDSYGDRGLLTRRLLPVVCHRKDAALFQGQKAQCLKAAQEGAVLVSARIAKGEQEIMDTAVAMGCPVVLLIDNGMPDIYHPSTERIEQCLAGKVLMVTPWQYHYRTAEETISTTECKSMNCVVQALCRTRDDWWKRI